MQSFGTASPYGKLDLRNKGSLCADDIKRMSLKSDENKNYKSYGDYQFS